MIQLASNEKHKLVLRPWREDSGWGRGWRRWGDAYEREWKAQAPFTRVLGCICNVLQVMNRAIRQRRLLAPQGTPAFWQAGSFRCKRAQTSVSGSWRNVPQQRNIRLLMSNYSEKSF